MEVTPEGRIYQKYITSIELPSYEFILYYAEEMKESISEFSHYHELYQIYYVMENAITIDVGDTTITLSEKELLLLAKNIKHHVLYEPDRSKRYFTMIFDLNPLAQDSHSGYDREQECKDIESVLKKLDKKGFILSHDSFRADSLIEQILQEGSRKQIGWNTCLNFYYFRFFIEAIRHIEPKLAEDRQPCGKLNLAIEATKYIHKHYFAEDLSLENVSKHLNISPRHVNRAYQSMFGTTFMKNLNYLRIEYAKNYLCTTKYPIDKIAELVGFASTRTLFKLFKEYEGISISQYRSRHQRNFQLEEHAKKHLTHVKDNDAETEE